MSPTPDELTIEQMQEAIMALGWQWHERVYNDGTMNNCYIDFTQDKDPFALNGYPKLFPEDRLSWGRYSRKGSWTMAYNYIVLGIK